ncbi:MAG: hypothetical protein AB1847_06135 [bacterium]
MSTGYIFFSPPPYPSYPGSTTIVLSRLHEYLYSFKPSIRIPLPDALPHFKYS